MKLVPYLSIAFLAMLFVVLFLRREAVLSDAAAVPLALLAVIGFAGCTVWIGIRAIREAKARRHT